MITGRVLVRLGEEPGVLDEGGDRRALYALERCPDGAEVVIDVSGRGWVSSDCAHILHTQGKRLRLIVQGADPSVVSQFVRAAHSGSVEAFA